MDDEAGLPPAAGAICRTSAPLPILIDRISKTPPIYAPCYPAARSRWFWIAFRQRANSLIGSHHQPIGAFMSGNRILWGQITLVLAVVLATTWGATQWTAWRLGFQPQLGPPWFSIADVSIYLPPVFFLWWYHYDAYAPRIFIEGAAIAASGGFASIAIAIGMSVWRAREVKAITTYGSARWATRNE